MSRVKRSISARKKRRKVLEQAKGYRATKTSSYKRAKEQVQRSGQYAYRDRRVRKREFRKLWIVRINAGARENGMSYNQFMHGLQLAQIELDRKILAELAVNDPSYFASLVEQARAAIAAGQSEAARKAVAEAKPDDWRTPFRAAAFCLDNNVNLDEAGTWIDRSIAAKATFYNTLSKARWTYSKGHKAEAIALAKKAIEIGQAADTKADIAPAQALLAEWSR